MGLGAIGRALAERGRALGLDELLARADIVSMHVPLTGQNHHLIGPAELKAMKPTAWLVNTARGPLVDTTALVDALERGEIAGAALDVTDPEPLPPEHPLRASDDVVLTPHTAFSSDGSLAELARKAATNVVDVLRRGCRLRWSTPRC